MLATHALVTPIPKLTAFVLSLSTTPSKSSGSVPGFINFYRRRRFCRVITSMAGAEPVSVEIAGESKPEHVTGKWFSVPELRLRDHRFIVPLDYSFNSKTYPKITVFAREIVAGNLKFGAFWFRSLSVITKVNICVLVFVVGKEEQAMPYLLYLQGGPGFEGPRPSEASGWIQRACEEFRVILLDQV